MGTFKNKMKINHKNS